MRFRNLEVFVCIAEEGSLAATARHLNLSPTAVSDVLALLEEHYGATLIRRTTRSLSLTEEGLVLLDAARRLLAEERQVRATISHGSEALSGVIRFGAPTDFGRKYLLPVVDAFAVQHPGLVLEVELSDLNSDLAAGSYDFVIRDGKTPEPGLTHRHLAWGARVVCASPDFIKEKGAPQHPSDLVDFPCLMLRLRSGAALSWLFQVGGVQKRFPVNAARFSNDAGLIADWCRRGQGLAMKSRINLHSDIAAGRLVPVLEDFEIAGSQFNIVYQTAQAQPKRVQMLVEHIEKSFKQGVPALDASVTQ